MTNKEICESLNLNRAYVIWLLKRSGIQCRGTRKYSINKEYFKNIDSSNKAYFLGLLMADGCIKDYRSVHIALHKQDEHILESFKKELEYNTPLKIKSCNYPNGDRNYNMLNLEINSKDIVSDLAKYNIVPRKTYKKDLEIPNISYIGSFIRGFFDGDGSVYIKEVKKWKYLGVNFTGNLNLLNSLKTILSQYSIKCNKTFLCNEVYGRFAISEKESIKKIYKLMYEEADLYFFRKKEVFDNF